MRPLNHDEQLQWLRMYPRQGTCTACGKRTRIVIAADMHTGNNGYPCRDCLRTNRFETELFSDAQFGNDEPS